MVIRRIYREVDLAEFQKSLDQYQLVEPLLSVDTIPATSGTKD